MKKKPDYIIIAAIIGIVASLADVITMFVFANFFPGYSQLNDTISRLGSSNSPVSDQISAIWIGIGVLLILFGISFRLAFANKAKYAKISSWMIILYGIGEGIGSGAFKSDRIVNSLTTNAVIHEIVGAIGVISILLLSIFMQKVIPKNENPKFFLMSKIVFVSGIVFVILFLFRFYSDQTAFISVYKGL